MATGDGQPHLRVAGRTTDDRKRADAGALPGCVPQGKLECAKARTATGSRQTKLDAALLQQAMQLRQERPSRSVEQLIFLLEESGSAAPW